MSGWILWLALGFQAGAQVPAASPSASSTQAPVADPAVTALALKIYQQMRSGKVDPALLSDQMQQGLTPAALAQNKPVFDQLGDPTKLVLEKKDTIPQGTRWQYLATFPAAELHVSIFIDTTGKVAGYFLKP